MQFEIRLTPDSGPELQRFARQVPFATALALTAVARIAKPDVQREMPKVFDRPTPYTLNSLRVIPATKARLWAAVHLKDEPGKGGTPAHKFLDPEIEGGARRVKRFERAFRSEDIMPGTLYAIPGAGAKIDGYGNVPASEIRQVLSYLQAAQQRAGYQANTSARKRARLKRGTKSKRGFGLFVASKTRAKTRHLHPGVYKRYYFAWGTAIKPVFLFKGPPRYKERLPLRQVVDRTVKREYARQFNAAMERAIRTAR